MYNRRRKAISQAHIAKQCRLYGALARGNRAFKTDQPAESNPFLRTTKEYKVWLEGWYLGKEQAGEKK